MSLYRPSTENKKRMTAKYISATFQMPRIKKKKIEGLPERQKHSAPTKEWDPDCSSDFSSDQKIQHSVLRGKY